MCCLQFLCNFAWLWSVAFADFCAFAALSVLPSVSL